MSTSGPGVVTPYAELRKRIEQKDRGLREKVMTLEEAVNLINDGSQVALGGSMYSRTPMAAIFELIRQRKKDLVISRSIASTDGDLLLVANATRHIITSWFSPAVTWGVSPVMRHYIQSGEAIFEEWSHMNIGLRFRAGAMGVPFLPSRAMLGSDVEVRLGGKVKELDCPYTGEKLLLVPALNPDFALLHVPRADPYGNAQIDGLPFMDPDIALAADRVILTCEQIIDNTEIRRAPDRTLIPFFCVEAVAEVPYGAFPHECYGLYEPDFRHIDTFVGRMKDRGVEGVQEYLEEYVYGVGSWEEHLERIGFRSVLAATTNARKIHGH